MEHTEFQIKSINFANFCLDRWINDEEGFKQSILNSEPLRYCMNDVLKTLVGLGEITRLEIKNNGVYLTEALKWGATPKNEMAIANCIIMLSIMADKRLKVTTGKE